MAVARYLADGTRDTSFGSNGVVLVDFGYEDVGRGIAVDASNRIVVTGYVQTASSNYYDIGLIRLDANGNLDLNQASVDSVWSFAAA
jgi:hypothetical protein